MSSNDGETISRHIFATDSKRNDGGEVIDHEILERWRGEREGREKGKRGGEGEGRGGRDKEGGEWMIMSQQN